MMLLREGGGSVEIPGGMYRVSYPFIEMKHRVEIFGHGQATRIVAFTDKGIPSTKNGSYECTGVFHTGSYTTPMSGGTNQNKPMRMGVRDLFIRTNKYNLPLDSKSNQIFLEKHTQPVDNVAGVIFHTALRTLTPVSRTQCPPCPTSKSGTPPLALRSWAWTTRA